MSRGSSPDAQIAANQHDHAAYAEADEVTSDGDDQTNPCGEIEGGDSGRADTPAAHVYEPPTDEQLVNFVTVMALGPGATPEQKETTRTMLELPELRQAWLDRHREMQEAAWNL